MQRPVVTSIAEAEKYINSIPKFTSKHSIDETRAFLEKLGMPGCKIPIIHVAGTNGKGSTCAYLNGIMSEAGLITGVFTSPHLVDIRERFTFAGDMISEEDFLGCFEMVLDEIEWDALDMYHPTYFEFLFFMGMLYWQEKNPDILILETGLGGLLDATNSVPEKIAAVITRISLEHTQYLGDTVEAIAGQKAGIIKSGCDVFINGCVPEATSVIVDKANQCGCNLLSADKNSFSISKITSRGIDFSLSTRYYGCICLSVPSNALYQLENISLAVMCAENLADKYDFIKLSEDAIVKGVNKTIWPGRMECVADGIYVDGAHNDDGIRAFLDSVAVDGLERKNRKLIFSVVSDKDYTNMARRIEESMLFDGIIVVPMHTGRTTDTELLQSLFSSDVVVMDSVAKAISVAVAEHNFDRLYIAGSLYLVGEVKEFLENGVN